MNQSPTEELASEHEYVLVVVSAMEREAESIHSGGPVDRDAIAGMVDFTRNFTDGCHHTKEEKLLFPLAEQVLDAPEMEDLATGFARVEKEETDAGVLERYHQVAHELASHLAPDER